MAAKKKLVAARRRTAKKSAPKARTAAPRKAPRKAAAKPRRIRPRRQPESLRLRSASPSLTVADLEKSRAFYRDLLGFVEKERWEQDGVLRGVELVAGSVTFWLSQDDWKRGRGRVKGQGFRLYCGTTQDVDTLATRVKARGGTLTEEPKDQPWGGRAFSLVDPDGFAITIATE
jgi:lactoylglutathione lyase